MDIEGFPNCCTAEVIYDFPTDREFKRPLGMELEIKQKMAYYKADGDAILVATLTTKQEKSKQLLINLGWQCAGPFKKRRHKDRDLYLLYYALNKPDEIKVQPRDAKGRFIKSNPFK